MLFKREDSPLFFIWENIMEIIIIITTITISMIIGILTTLMMRYKKNLKSEINLNNYLIK